MAHKCRRAPLDATSSTQWQRHHTADLVLTGWSVSGSCVQETNNSIRRDDNQTVSMRSVGMQVHREKRESKPTSGCVVTSFEQALNTRLVLYSDSLRGTGSTTVHGWPRTTQSSKARSPLSCQHADDATDNHGTADHARCRCIIAPLFTDSSYFVNTLTDRKSVV